jgi:hypothetical protein
MQNGITHTAIAEQRWTEKGKTMEIKLRKRLIYAGDLWHKTFVCEEPGDFRKAIENAPSVDAVEVVRCKDCKHWSDGVRGCTDHVKC